MEVEKGKTFKYLKEKREVSQEVKDNLKYFNNMKKNIISALTEGEMTIPQLAKKISVPEPEVVFYLMSLVKYGYVQTGAVDDMDEYFYYKIKNNDKD
jgi:predicted transcriptional regulator